MPIYGCMKSAQAKAWAAWMAPPAMYCMKIQGVDRQSAMDQIFTSIWGESSWV